MTWYRPEGTQTQGLRDMWQVIHHDVDNLVEIGSADGGSIVVFKQCRPDLIVVAIDPWDVAGMYGEDVFQSFRRNTERFDLVSHIRATDEDAISHFLDGAIDAAYYDAVHEYEATKAAILRWIPKIRTGGWMCGHDYSDKFPGVIQAVNECATGTVYTFCDSSFAFQVARMPA